MTADPRLERALPGILADLGSGPTPDYVDTLLARTATTRQRPRWVFPERWIPMSAISERMATAPRVPIRAAVLLALLIFAAVAAAVLVGSQQRRLPPPFGPAGNGLIAYASSGDIYVGDPVTGRTRLLVGGPEVDSSPGFSPDGTRLAFLREVRTGQDAPVDIYVVGADGSGLARITPKPIVGWHSISWTPDGRQLAVTHDEGDVSQLDLIDASGDGKVTRIAAAAGADEVSFRPPDGREMLVRVLRAGKEGLFAMNPDGSHVREVVAALDPGDDPDVDLGNAAYSADGSRIFYQRADPASAPNVCCRLWVANADGSSAHEFMPPGAPSWDGEAVVSPDGTRIAYWHHANDRASQRVTVVRADGTGQRIETGPVLPNGGHWIWSPDSTRILMYPDGASSMLAYLLDPAGGPWKTVPWRSDPDLDWQRIAP